MKKIKFSKAQIKRYEKERQELIATRCSWLIQAGIVPTEIKKRLKELNFIIQNGSN